MAHIDISKKFFEKFNSLTSRKAKHACMYPTCENKTVNSHTISNKSSLSKIAENGKLISPQPVRDYKKNYSDILFKEIGVNEATTFHGFCIHHEKIFSSIDLNGVNTIRDLFLQIYRYSCKEIFLNKAEKRSNIEAFGWEFTINSDFEKSKYFNAYKVSEFFYDLLIDFPEAEKEIKTLPYYEDYMIFKPFSESFNLDIGVIYKNIKFKCPVALLNKITLKRNNQCYDCFIMLIPNEIGADLIIVSHKSDMSGFLSRLKNNIETLSFIESCMMLDGEWWLLPSVIKKWSDEKIKFVEDDFFCFYERPSLLYESYEVSLFDDLRLEFCKDLPNDRRDIELKKINTLPKREPIEERKRKYRDWWMDFNIKTRLNSTSS